MPSNKDPVQPKKKLCHQDFLNFASLCISLFLQAISPYKVAEIAESSSKHIFYQFSKSDRRSVSRPSIEFSKKYGQSSLSKVIGTERLRIKSYK